MKDFEAGVRGAIERLEKGADPKDVASDLRVLISPDILPCPCCGAEPELLESNQWERQIRCPECCLSSGIGPADEIIPLWNRRVKNE